MSKVIRVTRPYILALLTGVVVVSGVLGIGFRPVSGDRSPVRVVIRKGSNAEDIAGVLSERRLVRSPMLFRLACRIGGQGAKLKPGVYEMNRAMSVSAIIDHLVEGRTMESWVTVPEGFTARQVGDLLSAKRLADGTTFTRTAISGGSKFEDYPFLEGDNLEGYLFPDTYLVPRDANAEGIMRQMIDVFQQKVVDERRADIEKTIKRRFGSSVSFAEGLHRIVILASLVEREARTEKDRPLVAAVMWNRLAKPMRLEVDATVSYVPGESTNNKDKVLYSDLAINSPYNTYKNDGLPPGPICNPGLASIKAVLEPANVDYLFYVARRDGSHVFTRTYKEHLIARRAVRGGAR